MGLFSKKKKITQEIDEALNESSVENLDIDIEGFGEDTGAFAKVESNTTEEYSTDEFGAFEDVSAYENDMKFLGSELQLERVSEGTDELRDNTKKESSDSEESTESNEDSLDYTENEDAEEGNVDSLKEQEIEEEDNKYNEEVKEEASEKESVTEENEGGTELDEIETLELYLLIDNEKEKFNKYMREVGMPVKERFTEIEEADDVMLLADNKYRMVIVDTGTGKFTGVKARKKIADLVGMVDDDIRISVFYSDEALKHEIQNAIGKKKFKQIQCERYNGTVDMVKKVGMIENEKYEKNDSSAETSEDIIGKQELLYEITGKDDGIISKKVERKKYDKSELKILTTILEMKRSLEDSENEEEMLSGYELGFRE